MYYDNDSKGSSQIENERILKMIDESPEDACKNDPEIRAAFEESLRDLAEDIIEYNPGLAHLLLGMNGSTEPGEFHGRN